MKRLSQQPKTLVLATAIALGFAAVAGCSQDHNDTANTSAMPNAGAEGNMAAGTGDSTQPVSDTWITTKVKAALATTEGVDNTDIDVETNNGVVTLSGAASSQSSVNAMVAAAKDVKGVTRVDTASLRVGNAADNDGNSDDMAAGVGNSQQPVQDTWITTKVTAKLHTVDGLDNTDLGVETNDGVVTLSGRVDSQAMVDAAVKEAKTIKGVKDVDTSRVTVGPDTDQ